MQKSVVFLYISNKQYKKEIKTNSIYNSIKKNKIHRDKINQGGIVQQNLQNIAERN